MKMMCYAIMPKIMLLLDIPLIGKDIKEYFSNLVLGTMAEREKNGIIRHDMIHLLMEAKKGALKHEEASTKEHAGYATVEESSAVRKKVERKWSDDELVAQTVVFIIGGFDTTSTILTFLMYELAKNPEIQKKLQEEIDNYKRETSDTLTYNDLPKLKYLDMVVSESLRLWPSFGAVDRVATTKYTLPPPNDSCNSYEVQKNHAVWVPILNIHRDPQYFPNPMKFDPERFSDENKSSIQSGSYLPFGIGPRNCIGSRFALMIVKAVVFSMLSKFDIFVTSKTQIPVQLSKKTFNMITEKGMWLGLELRTT